MKNQIIEDAHICGNSLHIDLAYPRLENSEVKNIIIGLSDVRAADEIRVSYDFDRDGWKIEQASVFEYEPDDDVQDRGWVEVAFVAAWGSQAIPNPPKPNKCADGPIPAVFGLCEKKEYNEKRKN